MEANQPLTVDVRNTPERDARLSAHLRHCALWRTRFFTAMAVLMIFAAGNGFAQDAQDTTTSARTLQSKATIEGSRKSRDDLRRALQDARQSVNALGTPTGNAAPLPAADRGVPPSFLEPYRPQTGEASESASNPIQESDAGLSSLRRRIELLNMALKEEAEAKPEPGNENALTDGRATNPTTVTAPDPFPDARSGGNRPPPIDVTTSEMASDSAASETGEFGMAADPSARPAGATVLPAPINALEVANSLFQTGSYSKALEYYLAIEGASRDEHEEYWFQFFVASCQRILGDRAEAARRYRDLLATKSTIFPVKSAEWWLRHLDRTNYSKDTFEQISAQIDQIAKEFDK